MFGKSASKIVVLSCAFFVFWQGGGQAHKLNATSSIGNESVPIQLASDGSLGWPFSSLKYKYIFWNNIYGSNFIKQHSETVIV